MIALLMLTCGLLACLCGVAITCQNAGRSRYDGEIPEKSGQYARAFLVLFAGDLLLQTYQINGRQQPLTIALADGFLTSAIFCTLSLYAGALAGRRTLSTPVAILALIVLLLSSLRSLIANGVVNDVPKSVAILLGLGWLFTSFMLAWAVAITASRAINATPQHPRLRSKVTGVAWPNVVVAILWSTVVLMAARAVFAPLLGGFPALLVALDSPFIDTLYISVFVLSGVVTRGLYSANERTAAVQPNEASVERWDRILQKADLVLEKHYSDPDLSMPRLAALIGCSEHRLSAALNRHRGISFFTYINERRIRAAQEHMRRGHATIVEIAYLCGYNARSTFYTAFKAVTGESVQSWRRTLVDQNSVSGPADSDNGFELRS